MPGVRASTVIGSVIFRPPPWTRCTKFPLLLSPIQPFPSEADWGFCSCPPIDDPYLRRCGGQYRRRAQRWPCVGTHWPTHPDTPCARGTRQGSPPPGLDVRPHTGRRTVMTEGVSGSRGRVLVPSGSPLL